MAGPQGPMGRINRLGREVAAGSEMRLAILLFGKVQSFSTCTCHPPTTPRPLPHTPHPGFRVCVNKKENLSLPNNHLTTAWARKSHTPHDGLTAGIADWGFVHRMRLHAKRVHKTNRTYTFSLSHMHAHTNMLIYSRKGK